MYRSVSVVSPWDVSSVLLLFGLGARPDLLGPLSSEASHPATNTPDAPDAPYICDTPDG
jgi:hypothetical protein